MKIVFLDAATIGSVSTMSQIEALGDFTAYDYTTAEQVHERIEGAEVVITNKVLFTREVMAAAPALRLICISATGTNNVDLAAAAELGIEVKNVAGYSTQSVVQMTFALLLELLCHTSSYNNYVHSGAYSASPSFTCVEPRFHQLSNMRYGIIGLGAIGRGVASVASAFGAEVCYYSTSGQNSTSDYERLELDELLATCDVISIHAPLNDKTHNLIDAAALAKMKPSAVIINVGRGGIIDEQALATALNEGGIAGAGIDVFTREPIEQSNPLMSIEEPSRLVMTPHAAWASQEARERLIELVAGNIASWELGVVPSRTPLKKK